MKSRLDLNLLNVLVLLNKHRQLRPVAKALGKTESAVSKHLSKLREQLGDPLFVRGATEFEPTDYTLQMLPLISSGLDTIRNAVTHDEFVPENYERNIVIAMPSIAQYWIGDRLLIDLMATFPNAHVEITTWASRSVNDIQDGTLDLGVNYFNPELPKNIYQNTIGTLKPSIVTHESIDTSDFSQLLSMPFVLLETKGGAHRKAATKQLLESKGIYIHKRAIVDNVTCLLNTIKALDCATLLPSVGLVIEGFSTTEFPSRMELGELPPVVANYKLSHRANPLQQLLIKKIRHYLFSQK